MVLEYRIAIQYNIDRVRFEILLDRVPHKKLKFADFRRFVSNIPNTEAFRGKRIHIPIDQIADVDSKDHNILQRLDVILGSMHFRLNDLHKEKPEGSRNRAKRTVAKENVYKHINQLIRQIRPNFNIGVSTAVSEPSERWSQLYRHWLFVPRNSEKDTMAKTKRAPQTPT